MIGTFVAVLGSLLDQFAPARLGAMLAIGIMASGAVLSPRLRTLLPERACQVPMEMARNRSAVRTQWAWGFRLGLGFRTYCVTPALWVLLAVALGAPAMIAVASLGAYGGTRGSAIVAASIYRCRVEDARVAHDWVKSSSPQLFLLSAVTLALFALALASE